MNNYGLMPHNYCYINNKLHEKYKHRIFKIITVEDDFCHVELLNKSNDFGQCFKFIEPIPITPEFLIEKFGFINDGNFGVVYKKNELFRIIYKKNNQFFFELKYEEIELKYIHTLQNLYFIVTNEKLEII